MPPYLCLALYASSIALSHDRFWEGHQNKVAKSYIAESWSGITQRLATPSYEGDLSIAQAILLLAAIDLDGKWIGIVGS